VATAVLLIGTLLCIVVWYLYKPLSPEIIQVQEQAYQSALDDWEKNGQAIIQNCQEEMAAQQSIDPSYQQDCTNEALAPKPIDFGLYVLSLEDAWLSILVLVPKIISMIGIIWVGVAVGSEFRSGSIITWLYFEPRREVVFWSKLIASAIAAIAITILFEVVLLVGISIVSVIDNADMTLSGNYILNTAIPIMLFTIIVAIGTMCAASAFTMLTQRASFTIALSMGYVLIVDTLIGQLLPITGRFSIGNSIDAFALGHSTFTSTKCTVTFTGEVTCIPILNKLSRVDGFVELLIIFLVVTGIGWWRFQRTDIAN